MTVGVIASRYSLVLDKLRHQLIQYKVIHRLHYSCTKLHSFYPSVSPICPQCKSAEVPWVTSSGHAPNCTQSGRIFLSVSQEYYSCNLIPAPDTAVLGRLQHLTALTHWEQKTLQYGRVIAKRNILSLWNKETVPVFKTWLAEVTSLLHVETIQHDTSGRSNTFVKIWQPFITYLSSDDGKQHATCNQQ